MGFEKPILSLDFDGVIHSYVSPWTSAHEIQDYPVPGAMEFICNASKFFRVCIFSSRSHQDGGIEAMRTWMRTHFMTELAPPGGREMPDADAWLLSVSASDLLFILEEIEYPTEKPPAKVTIDDRAITFAGTFPDIDLLVNFKPWNRL